MLILLSPAKTLDMDAPVEITDATQPNFLDQSTILVNRLRQYRVKGLGRLMNISEPLAELNVERFSQWKFPYAAGLSRPSILAFRGDVYVGFDADSMKKADLNFAQKHVRILSGLYGILRPKDLMLPYRLEMGTTLKTRRGKNLYQFWGERLTASLNSELQDFQQPGVVNLASHEYFKVIQPGKLAASLVSPVFKDQKNGEYKVIGFFAKKARGAMARYLVDHRIEDVGEIVGFDRLGYKFNKKLSTAKAPVFLRTEKAANDLL